MSTLVLLAAAAIASAVEAVEAFTIVLATGMTRGWRSAIEGTVSALALLAALVAVFGPGLVHAVPVDVLRLVVGTFLLAFGLQWLRKAIMRAVGLKAKHDEDAIFAEQVAELRREGAEAGGRTRDGAGFATSFKAVFLEGFEVVAIVVALGATSHRVGTVSIGAGIGVAVVTAAGVTFRRQLSAVPENAMKTVVGLLLVSFGTFWVGEGAQLHWPGSDAAILVLVAGYALVTWAAVALMRRLTAPAVDRSGAAGSVPVGTPTAGEVAS